MSDNYQVGGSLPADAPSYVTRQADHDLCAGLKAGEFCYVLNSRQMGKSSLRVQTMQRLIAEGIACAVIDLTRIGSQNVTPDQWYAGVVRTLVNSFDLSDRINVRTWWRDRDHLSAVQRFSEFLETVLLPETSQPLVVFVDEIDTVLSLPFSLDDFFAVIRDCYNQRADKPDYHRLTFCLLGVATPSDLIQDKRRTPFNIGRAIELNGFQLNEAQPLAEGLTAASSDPQAVLHAVLTWTGGQPFLTQKVCRLISNTDAEIPLGEELPFVSNLVQTHIIDNWESQDEPEHLRTIRDRLLQDDQQKAQLLGLYQSLLQDIDIPATAKADQLELRLTGLVVERQGMLRVYNPIYAAVFNADWVQAILANLRPYADAITAWLASNRTDDSRLLRGQTLENALAWAAGKRLSDDDNQFLRASQDITRRDVQLALDAQMEANHILATANHTAKQRLGIASTVSAVMVALAIGSWLWAQGKINTAEARVKGAEFEVDTVRSQAGILTLASQHILDIANRNVEQANTDLTNTQAKLNDTQAEQQATQARIQLTNRQLEATNRKARDAEGRANRALTRLSNAQVELEIIEILRQNESLRSQERYSESIDILNRLINNNSRNAYSLASRGETYYRARNYIAALNDFNRALDISPQYVLAYVGRGMTHYQLGNYREALIDFNNALQLEPLNVRALEFRGYVNEELGNYDAALNDFNEILSLHVECACRSHTSRGRVYRLMRRYEEALREFTLALEANSDYTPIFGERGETYLLMGSYEEALQDFNRVLEPNYHRELASRGIAYREMQYYKEALNDFERSLEIYPDDSRTLAARGEAYRQMEQYEQALADFNRALELYSEDAWTLGRRGQTYRALERYEEALANLDRAIELDPSLQWAVEEREQVRQRVGK
ncbi:MAG: tetratricopeptide repeat protein [Oculatellaceae cyanobacterium bins.114]|nr:tetratricopeptide repeat protein [Oculatellaceae cyanobacterium bins.114]